MRRLHVGKAATPLEELTDWIRDFHILLVKISENHPQFSSWSVTVGTPLTLTLTVNFANTDRVERSFNFLKQGESLSNAPTVGTPVIDRIDE